MQDPLAPLGLSFDIGHLSGEHLWNTFRQTRGSSWPLAGAVAHLPDILLSSLHSAPR